MKPVPPARLWGFLARKEPIGVLLRRGPSKRVLMIRWDLRNDTFKTGQWLKGRVYEHRSDLSPDGKLFIYFAANQRPPMISWTAISKPPYFTALALWPKGDCWNGGGWFVAEKKIRLNHAQSETKLDRRFRLGPIKISGYAEYRGEDSTVWDFVRERDGWKIVTEGKAIYRGLQTGWVQDPPSQWLRPNPTRKTFVLEMLITGVGGKNTPWYKLRYRVLRTDDVLTDLGLADWADWDACGNLVFAKSGCLYRSRLDNAFSDEPAQLADFNSLQFENVLPTPEATRW